MKRKKEVDFSEMLELPVKDLTLEHLQKLKVYLCSQVIYHMILLLDNKYFLDRQCYHYFCLKCLRIFICSEYQDNADVNHFTLPGCHFTEDLC